MPLCASCCLGQALARQLRRPGLRWPASAPHDGIWRAGDHVASLDLGGNDCEDVGDSLRQYGSLVSLCLGGNRLSTLPTAAQVGGPAPDSTTRFPIITATIRAAACSSCARRTEVHVG